MSLKLLWFVIIKYFTLCKRILHSQTNFAVWRVVMVFRCPCALVWVDISPCMFSSGLLVIFLSGVIMLSGLECVHTHAKSIQVFIKVSFQNPIACRNFILELLLTLIINIFGIFQMNEWLVRDRNKCSFNWDATEIVLSFRTRMHQSDRRPQWSYGGWSG